MTSRLAINGGDPVRTSPFPSWPVADDREAEAIVDVLRSRSWGSTSGDKVAKFEAAFAQLAGVRNCTCVCNGTVAIDAALRAVGVGPGDEVIVPPYTFIATVAAVLYVGAIPVFADILGDTHSIDAASVAERIGSRTKAVIAVHIGGRPCDLDAVTEVARSGNIALIEDAAQAHGASWRGTGVGGFGSAGTFSFQSSKNLTAGEGGAIVTNDPVIADRVYSLANVGRIRGGEWYDHHAVGYNLRLTEFQAAILIEQLKRHPEQQERRESCARELTRLLGSIDGVFTAPADERITAHGRHLFLMRIPALRPDGLRDRFVTALRAEGIPASPGYGGLHRNDAILGMTTRNAVFADADAPEPRCPVADEVVLDTVWLPQNVLLAAPGEMGDIAMAIKKVLEQVDDL